MNNSSFVYWNYLPTELKMAIIKQSNEETRKTLRMCSKNVKELVDHVWAREIYEIQLWCISLPYSISLIHTKYTKKISLDFNSFDDFQQNVFDRLKEYEFIGKMEIFASAENPLCLMLSPEDGQLMKIGKLQLYGNINIEKCLEKVDPVHLECLELNDLEAPVEIYDIPLVANVNKLVVKDENIRIDQLMKLENRSLDLGRCEELDFEGFKTYIQKCVLNLDHKQVSFRLMLAGPETNYDTLFEGFDIIENGNSKRVVINSKSKRFQLNVEYYYYGDIIATTSVSPHLKKRNFTVFDDITLESMPGKIHTIMMKESISYNYYCFDSPEKLQKRLIKENREIDYIKTLSIEFGEDMDHWSNWVFCPKNQQITVGSLKVDEETNIVDCLQQLEPVHLKEITIKKDTSNGEIYNMQQIIKAKMLDIHECRINDAQLLKLNAVSLSLTAVEHRNTTHFGIDAFLKKCIRNLDKNDYDITLKGFLNGEETFEIFDELDFVVTEFDQNCYVVLITSPFPRYLLEVEIRCNENLIARRIEKRFLKYNNNVI